MVRILVIYQPYPKSLPYWYTITSMLWEVLLNARCLACLLLLCHTIHSVIFHCPSYWHQIILSHKNNLKSIQTTLSHAGSNMPFHLIVIWTQNPLFHHLKWDFCVLFNSSGLWHHVTRLSFQDNSLWAWRLLGPISHTLFMHPNQGGHIRHAMVECSLNAIYLIPNLCMTNLDSLMLALSPIRNGMPHLDIVAPCLTHLKITMPTRAQEVYELLSHCQSLEHLHWIAPDKHLMTWTNPWWSCQSWCCFISDIVGWQSWSEPRNSSL